MSSSSPAPDPDDEAALWRQIVDNYGDRPEISPAATDPAPPDAPRHAEVVEPPDDPRDHFVPPPPPPAGWPTGPRAVAWFGLFGGPAVVLVLLVLGVVIPTWFGWLVLFGFIGGFGYLVASMRHEGDADGWDDGSQI
jgi:hypothetical protein